MTPDTAKKMINDLQSGMYINCVYCGHRYGPKEVEVPATALHRHIAECPEHPLSHLITACQGVMVHLAACNEYGDEPDPEYIYDALEHAVKEARG